MGLRAKVATATTTNTTTTHSKLLTNGHAKNASGKSSATNINGKCLANGNKLKKSPATTAMATNSKCQQTTLKLNTKCTATSLATTAETSNGSPAVAPQLNSVSSTCNSTTFRSNSTSALVAAVNAASAAAASCILLRRPQTLNVQQRREAPTEQTQSFFREIVSAWRAKARCNVVPAERTQELFHELSFHPNEKQISEMLQTAKMIARKGSRQSNGLTFGEFCVLAADLKRFRTSTFSNSICDKANLLSSLEQTDDSLTSSNSTNEKKKKSKKHENNCGTELRSTKSLSNVEDCRKKLAKTSSASDSSTPVEVFLGGSCNPTTWRADVAIPTLNDLGISFYNPQVSDWTPDLIELEHRAKEKARVLFFVMDSETRASAGAIEAAHIAGQNCKQLVLVLHPYKQNQTILNESISQQEYIDLMRNQLILRELVTRRGLPVLDNIPAGLQRTKEILAGIRDPPSNIATILIVVRGAFDRVNPVKGVITVEQCQRALLYLGYAQSLLNLENLGKIIASQRESLDANIITNTNSTKQPSAQNSTSNANITSNAADTGASSSYNNTEKTADINFELFCVISAYLSVLQQEIHESGCISPIKGTNVPPPPVYLTNMQGDENFAISYYALKNISRTSSNVSVPSSNASSDDRQSLNDWLVRSRDSGTSSPQPMEPLRSRSGALLSKQTNNKTQKILVENIESIERTEITTQIQTTQTINVTPSTHAASPSPLSLADTKSSLNNIMMEEESDSNDSVFSSSSSINSINYNNSSSDPFASVEYRDVYLGGSCFLRSKWRQDVAMPYLKSKGISYHLPALHESLQPAQLDFGLEKVFEDGRNVGAQERSFVRTRRKCRGTNVEEEEEVTVSEKTFSWALSPMTQNLYNPALLDASRVILFVIANDTRSLAPMTLAAHCIGLMYNVVLAVQMLPEDCVIGGEKLTPAAIKDYNRGRSYLIDLAKRQGVPVFNEIKSALECTVDKIKACHSRYRYD